MLTVLQLFGYNRGRGLKDNRHYEKAYRLGAKVLGHQNFKRRSYKNVLQQRS